MLIPMALGYFASFGGHSFVQKDTLKILFRTLREISFGYGQKARCKAP